MLSSRRARRRKAVANGGATMACEGCANGIGKGEPADGVETEKLLFFFSFLEQPANFLHDPVFFYNHVRFVLDLDFVAAMSSKEDAVTGPEAAKHDAFLGGRNFAFWKERFYLTLS